MGGDKGGGGGSDALNALAATQQQIAEQLMPLTSMQIADQMAFQFGEDVWRPEFKGGGGTSIRGTPTGSGAPGSFPGSIEYEATIPLGEYVGNSSFTYEGIPGNTSWVNPETGELWQKSREKRSIEDTFAAPLLVSPQNPAYAAAKERMLETMPAGGALESSLGQFELGFARERDLARQVATSALMGTPPALGGLSTAWNAPAASQAATAQQQQAMMGQQGLSSVGNLLGTLGSAALWSK